MWKYLKKYWYLALLAPVSMCGEVLMDLMQPRLMSAIVDEGVLGLSNGGVSDLHMIITTGLKMLGCILVGSCFGILSGVFANMCSQNFGNDVRKACFKNMMSLSFEQTDKFSTGSLVTRVTNDVTQVQNMVGMCIRGFVRNIMFFIGGIICMLKLDLSFGIVVACALPFIAFLVVFFIGKANPIYGVLQMKLDKVNGVMQENVAGARVVKAFVKEEHEKTRFSKANGELVGTQLKVLLLLSYLSPLMNIVLNIAVVAVIYVGSVKVQAGVVTPGSIMAAITYVSQILNGIMMMAMVFQNISRGAASAKRLNEVIECVPAIADGDFDGETQETGSVEFRNVSFSYPCGGGETVLAGINLKINPGETLGILGATGCGKTTLVNLIPRFYDATSGEVLVDGVNVKDYKLSALRDKIAVALQKSELFSETIKENIMWGAANATDEEIKYAGVIAQADDFITSQPEGYETMVAEKGMSLSGGHKQRIAISRAVLKKAEIMIFDDSTSALDLKTEARLYEALNNECAGVTKIIIAQRIASVKNADRIAVLDGGGILACDTHEKLMETCAEYRDIYNSQLKGGVSDAG